VARRNDDSGTISPTRRAVLVLLAGVPLALLPACVDRALWTYWLAFVLLDLVVLGADLIFGPRLGRIEAAYEGPERLFVGEAQTVRLLLTNRDNRVTLRAKVDVSGGLDAIDATERLRLDGGRTALRLSLRAGRRGISRLDALWVRACGPLGLIARSRRIPLATRLHVDPNFLGAGRDAIEYFSTNNIEPGVRVERYRGDGSEFDHLQEYAPGFDIRTIDWKASARHAKLFAREYRAERNRQVILAIDSGRLMGEPLEGIARLDHAIRAALILAYVSLHVGDRVGLISFDETLRHYCAPVRGPSSIGALNAVASRIEYSAHETNYTLSLLELARRHVRRTLVVVMTDFVDTITAELMVENLSRVARRHSVLFVSMKDPLVEVEESSRPADLLGLHRTVVASRLLQEREKVLARLRRQGIHCISAAPGEISARLIDEYLKLKRAEAF